MSWKETPVGTSGNFQSMDFYEKEYTLYKFIFLLKESTLSFVFSCFTEQYSTVLGMAGLFLLLKYPLSSSHSPL